MLNIVQSRFSSGKNINTFLKLIIVLFILSGALFSQVTQQWVARYVEAGAGFGNAVAVDASGNIYVTGQIADDIATLKYNSGGILQWIATYNGLGSGEDRAEGIAIDNSGNVYITGWSDGGFTGDDYITIKYNSSGVQQWVQRYYFPGSGVVDDNAFSIGVDNSGNVYVTGKSIGTLGPGGTGIDIATIKYNSTGVQQWVKRYDGQLHIGDAAFSLALDNSGNVYVTGTSFGVFGLDTNFAITTIKYNSSGSEVWVRKYDRPGEHDDAGTVVKADGSGNVYVTGRIMIINGLDYDYVTIKYNSGGGQLWVQIYNEPGNMWDVPISMALDGSGNVYVTGESAFNIATVKYNSSGGLQWVQKYNGPGNGYDAGSSIVVDASGNSYVTGWSAGIGSGDDMVTMRYSPSGVQQWLQRYNGPSNGGDAAGSVAIDTWGNVYVTGASTGIGTDLDITTIRYTQQIGIEKISTEIPNSFSLYQNYPNPFNPSTKFKLEIAKLSEVKIVVFDVLGREITTLVNEQLKPGTYEVDFDGSKFASGIYFYRLETNGFTYTKKMVLIK